MDLSPDQGAWQINPGVSPKGILQRYRSHPAQARERIDDLWSLDPGQFTGVNPSSSG